jgi:hypothetical protein
VRPWSIEVWLLKISVAFEDRGVWLLKIGIVAFEDQESA